MTPILGFGFLAKSGKQEEGKFVETGFVQAVSWGWAST